VQAGGDCDFELGADPVGGGDENRILESCRLEIEECAETTEARVATAPRRRLRQRLYRLDQRRAGIDVDASLAIAVLAVTVGEILAPYGVLTRCSL